MRPALGYPVGAALGDYAGESATRRGRRLETPGAGVLPISNCIVPAKQREQKQCDIPLLCFMEGGRVLTQLFPRAAGKVLRLALRLPVANFLQIADRRASGGKRVQVVRGTEFRRERRDPEPALCLSLPNRAPPGFVCFQVHLVFRGSRVRHLGPLLIAHARMQVQAVIGALADGAGRRRRAPALCIHAGGRRGFSPEGNPDAAARFMRFDKTTSRHGTDILPVTGRRNL